MNPVPHIAARQLASREAAADFLARLRDEAEVTRALIVAGRQRARRAPTIPARIAGDRTAGGARHTQRRHRRVPGRPSQDPRGDPYGGTRPENRVRGAQWDRSVHGHAVLLRGQAILDWLARLRARGVVLPVRVGVAGPASSARCSTTACAAASATRSAPWGRTAISLTHLLAQHGPEKVVRRIAASPAELGVAGLHLFPFGGFARSAQWIDNVAAGRFRLSEPDESFCLQTDNHAN